MVLHFHFVICFHFKILLRYWRNESSYRVENVEDNVDKDVSSGTDGMYVFHEGCNVCKWYIVVVSLTKVLLLQVNTLGTDGKYFFKRSSKIFCSY